MQLTWNEMRDRYAGYGSTASTPEIERLRGFVTDVRSIFIDEGDEWIADLSGADVVDAITHLLEAHRLGPNR